MKSPDDREDRLQIDVPARRQAEEVRGQSVGARVPCPGEVLQLVGAEDTVGADQAVGAGEARVGLRGMDKQQEKVKGGFPAVM